MRRFLDRNGDKKKRYSIFIAGSIFILLLAAALIKGVGTPANLLYQWLYYFIFIALAEEIECRGLLPALMEKSGFPEWCVWVIPGVLFGLLIFASFNRGIRYSD